MNKSETIAGLAAALASAQGELENADKKSVNPHFKNKYADLAEILNTVRPVLSKHGLSVIQFPSFSSGVAHVETVLAHKSGEWMSETCSAPVAKADPQGVGSAITYLRRYSLAAVAGIAQEDDDGNGASKKPNGNGSSSTVAPPDLATKDQIAAINAAFLGNPDDKLRWCNEFYERHKSPTRITKVEEITARAAAAMIQELQGKEA